MNIKEIIRFIIVGCVAVFTDYLLYHFSSGFLSIFYSKILSFVCGSLVAFIANKLWTFNQNSKRAFQILKFGLLYSASLIANTAINAFVFDAMNDKIMAFICATGSSAGLNFFGQKYWVFK